MNVLKTIYDLLNSASNVTDIVGTRIYPSVVPQKQASPYISFWCDDNVPTDHKDGVSDLDTYFVSLECYSKNALEAVDIANYARTALDRWHGANSGNNIDKIIFERQEGPSFDAENELYYVDIEFRVRAKVNFGGGGTYLMDISVYVNGDLDSTAQIDPTVGNTINITA